MPTNQIQALHGIANQLRIHSISSTTAAGSGHVTSCASAAEIVATLFFGHMRYRPDDPEYPNNDRFILSKGHAAPILYAAWAEAGLFSPDELNKLRKFDCDLEGHPTPRLPFVDVATGSLGQGLSCGVGMAISARKDLLDFRVYVLLGDGECAEGSVWEAASFAGIQKLNNLVAIVDVNRLGQSQETAFSHALDVYARRFEAFGWSTIAIDGHNVEEILQALSRAGREDRPLAIIARTLKGKGLAISDKDNWHGKPLPKDQAQQAIAELQPHAIAAGEIAIPEPGGVPSHHFEVSERIENHLPYKPGDAVATREAYGSALVRLGHMDPHVVALDGDVKNSTFSEKFAKEFPNRFIESYIAEQNMVGMAVGLAALGKIPFVSTFAAFFTRAFDQIRMGAVSFTNIKLCGSHAGVSIGEDGPSQMGLEDIAMMRAVQGSVVLYPCDAVSTEKLVEEMHRLEGLAYLRSSRPKTPVIYNNDEEFPIGGCKILRQSDQDVATIAAAGITVFEALDAADALEREGIHVTVIDAYSIKPLAETAILDAARKTNSMVLTVEDHYPEGGLGDAVAGSLSREGIRVYKLAIHELPHSGEPDELIARYEIDADSIVRKVKSILASIESLQFPERTEAFTEM